MPLLSPSAKVGSFATASLAKVVPDAKPSTAWAEKETWTSLEVKPALRSGGMEGVVWARAAESRTAIAAVRWRKWMAMMVKCVTTIKQ